MDKERVTFGSKIGVILATVGCAVGLGSIWRFPYMVGENGGGAFLLVFLLCTAFLGLPIMITEFFIGRHSRSNAAGAFKKLAPGTQWKWIGYNGVLAAFLILGFYSVVSPSSSSASIPSSPGGRSSTSGKPSAAPSMGRRRRSSRPTSVPSPVVWCAPSCGRWSSSA